MLGSRRSRGGPIMTLLSVLRSLGASSPLIISVLLKEALSLALVGTVFGILLTYFAQWSMEHIGHSGLTQETVYGWWPIAGAIAVCGAALGTIAPAARAVRQDVIDALSYE